MSQIGQFAPSIDCGTFHGIQVAGASVAMDDLTFGVRAFSITDQVAGLISAVTVTLTGCIEMISWALMANDSTLEHSKTLGKTQIRNFSTLANTLAQTRPKWF